jgi:hypothetical protein
MKPARATAPENARNLNPYASDKSSDKGPIWIGAVTLAVSVIHLLTIWPIVMDDAVVVVFQ